MQQNSLHEDIKENTRWLRDCKMQAIRQASLVKTTTSEGYEMSLTLEETIAAAEQIYQWLIK